MATPHDALFKAVFAAPGDAADLIRPLLPAPLAAAIDWSSLVLVPGSFIDDALRQTHADLLFEVRIRGRRALLYLLAEHKSRGDRFTSLQLLGYELAIWTQWRKDHPRARRVPPIVPIVVHHGRRPWRAPTSLLPLFDLRGLEPAAARALAALQPAFAFSLDDVSRCDDASLRGRDASPLAQLALASLRTLRGASVQATLTAIATWLDVVARALAIPGGGERMDVLWSYVLAVSKVTDAQLSATVRPAGTLAEESVMSTAKRLHAKGKAEGRAEGRAEGHAEGRAEGHAEFLLRLLDARFGPLPIAVVARVHAAPTADLERWAIAVLSAPTLAAVFAAG